MLSQNLLLTKPDSQKIILSEDWLATILGLALILIFLLGAPISAPSYNWNSFDDLSSKVLAITNLISILKQFVLIYLSSAIAVYFSGKSIRPLLKMIVVLFMTAQVAQVLAGNSVIKSYNLEAVIFCLILGLIVQGWKKIFCKDRKVPTCLSSMEISCFPDQGSTVANYSDYKNIAQSSEDR